ncbi:hypothetical protein D7Z54_25410 [Salibacterium salarium]|uniref:Uncharacterized protein n=1 Tax=Salibacterium salarium TaxID=284579 RepID=A0A3R9QPQ0_9BACI|nr:hypothetical protein [Salibacterium salarium]RSL30573.1 hypothetical protein D7Z54_25410 [Salibacterium salarium]
MSKSFEERMKELEEGYNNMSDSISPDKIIESVEKTKKKSRWKRIYTTGGGVLAAGIAALLIMSQTSVAPGGDNVENNEQPMEESQQDDEVPAFTEERAVQVMNAYEESFVSLIDEANQNNQKINSYQSIDEVKQHFINVMSDELATWMTGSYFREEDDGVYVIPKDGPTWFQEDQSFELEEVSEEHFKIVQERNNELLGHREMIYHATYREEQWILDDIETNVLDEQTNENPESEGQENIMDTSETVLSMLASQDMGSLSSLVHPEKGVLFSPYVNIDKEDARVFEQEEVEQFFETDQVYEWGVYDGRGDTIEQTPSEYYEEFIFDRDFQNADEILVDDIEQRGNMSSNMKDVFPDSTVVEYHIEASGESGGMDWASLHLVFEQDTEGSWKLVAVVHDQWTI